MYTCLARRNHCIKVRVNALYCVSCWLVLIWSSLTLVQFLQMGLCTFNESFRISLTSMERERPFIWKTQRNNMAVDIAMEMLLWIMTGNLSTGNLQWNQCSHRSGDMRLNNGGIQNTGWDRQLCECERIHDCNRPDNWKK
jgi:hypothetical protein